MKTVELQVQGMSCGSCVKHVTEALRPLEGVSDVTVDLQAGRVKVSGVSDGHALLAALEDAGYPAQLTTVESVASKKTSGCGGNGGGCCCR
ncbi:heavy-metal-associated domain-containing protein [Pseudomonas corrugata]|uniref:Heavy-metal-associated domain-containing protein n=1 Tax=Pseudomonas corrugata TaxID=47879 RepID=A0A7Y5Z7F3_9PSED|nr:heavy-metal-associated domain-containing protein [Pseudomonas corrugata]NUT88412.1 heavy-metal-associated domain-containing protein [Pseudomonas corrugata]